MRPLHEQVAADLRAKIMAGELRPDDQLKSTAQLMAQYKASNPTIQRATDMLKSEGFLYSQRGKGIFVRSKQPFIVDVSAYFAPSPHGYTYDLVKVAEVEPPAEVAELFGLGEGGTAVLRQRITRHQGEPIELCYSYYPSDLAVGTPLVEEGRIRGGAPKVLKDLGFPEIRFEDQVSARMPTSEEIELLDLPEVPVIRQFRIMYSTGDRPVEVSVLIKGGHLYELRYQQAVS
jgi:GntR family transcriptional regulator